MPCPVFTAVAFRADAAFFFTAVVFLADAAFFFTAVVLLADAAFFFSALRFFAMSAPLAQKEGVSIADRLVLAGSAVLASLRSHTATLNSEATVDLDRYHG